MNRYPLWKYLLLAFALVVGLLYTLPNFFGEAPAVQVSSGKATLKLDASIVPRIDAALKAADIRADFVQFEGNSAKARFADTDTQIRAKDAIAKALDPDPNDPSYIVALNLLSRSPTWLTKLHALPMYLGLDLRGGVHFLMQVDMKAALSKKAESYAGDLRSLLRDKGVRHAGIVREGDTIAIRFRDRAILTQAQALLADQMPDLQWVEGADGSDFKLTGSLKPDAARRVQEQALKQNITTLHNRVNELGVAEPVIQQQGSDRVVVQLPGVQDTAKAKDIIGRTANLEFRLADMSPEARAALDGRAPVPFGRERFGVGRGAPVIVHREVIASGDMLTDAQPRPDQYNQPAVSVTLDSKGGRRMLETTRSNVGNFMAAILFEKNKGEVLTVARIQGEFGNQFQITGMGTTEAANDLALLLRAGGLAAPMEIIEERTIGPSLGKEN
ncbi:MAG TPA: preprotein translocase subunit SecD, partial [Burkholderiaceae bacterium]|nr:preprotein translocase subunit SecD [Burkholderiaceae bacterium]